MIIKPGIIFLFTIITYSVHITDAQRTLKTLYPQYSWKYLDFQFPTQAIRDAAIRNGVYIKGNAFPIDIDVYYGAYETLQFVTMPRFFNGIPVTLGTITSVNCDGGPIIAPFPSYDWQQSGSCSGFTNVFRVFVDEYQRLWVLDSGVINDKQTCLAQLVIFDLSRAGYPALLIHKFSNTLYKPMSLFIAPIVDARNGYDSMAYIADVTGFGIIVFDYKNNKSWRAESQSTHLRPIQQFSKFYIDRESFDLMDGVFGMAVSPKNYNNRQLFFHSLASITENRIPLSLLDNPNNWPTFLTNPNQFVQMGSRANFQTTVQAMDRNGNMFFGSITPLGIGCWDSLTTYTNANLKLLSQNDVTMQFISGLKIVTDRYGVQQLWALSCRFQKIMNGTRNINEINYRVMAIPVTELLGGSQYPRC